VILACLQVTGFTVEDRRQSSAPVNDCALDFFRHINCRSFLVTVLTEPKDMTIRRAIVHVWFIFLAECETLNFIDVGRHRSTAWTTTPRQWLILPVMWPVFLTKLCVETSCTNMCLHNPCWLVNILLNVYLQWQKPTTNKCENIMTSELCHQ